MANNLLEIKQLSTDGKKYALSQIDLTVTEGGIYRRMGAA